MAKRGQAQRKRKPLKSWLSRRDLIEVVIMIALLSIIAIIAHKLRVPSTLPIEKVHFVSRHQHLTPRELERAVMSSLRGGFFNVDLAAIERSLEQLAWVDTASVRRQWPDTLLIKIREQQPVAQWGKDGLLNRRGEVFYPHNKSAHQGLPVLYGPQGRERELIARFRRTHEVLMSVGLRLHALVEDERRAWHVLLANGIPVELGRKEPGARLERFVKIYPKTLALRATEIASVDLRYTNGFSVAWKVPRDGDSGTKQTRRAQ